LARELEVDHGEELFGVDGFEEERWELGFGEDVHFVLDGVEGHAGEEDDWEGAAVLLHVGEDVEAVTVGHLEVEEDEVHRAVFEVEDGGLTVAGFIDVETIVAEEVGECETFDRGVVAQKNPGPRGNRIRSHYTAFGAYFTVHQL
jgi:hypothetical protein